MKKNFDHILNLFLKVDSLSVRPACPAKLKERSREYPSKPLAKTDVSKGEYTLRSWIRYVCFANTHHERVLNSRRNLIYIMFFILFKIIDVYSFCPLNRADLVLFSYDRPLQLYSFLESVKKYIFGIEEIHVIYRVSNNEFESGYDIVKKDFADVIFHKQLKADDFKPLTLESIFNNGSRYIIFGVDDIIVKDYVNLGTCINYLEKSNSYGFYLRMGKNIVECYMHFNEPTPVPKMNQISPPVTLSEARRAQSNGSPEYLLTNVYNGVFQWSLNDGKGDWKYPNNLDMTIYRKSDLKQLYNYNFQNPSALEAVWADNANYNQRGLCFEQSKIVNLPLNLVIDEARNLDNRNSSLFNTKELLDKFMSGFKIDINKFYRINNLAPHAAIVPTFIPRTI